MIHVQDVSKGFGGRLLFENVNATFPRGSNFGLTGPNGSGKSTMMKILIGELETDSGTISRPERTGWLRQDQSAFDDLRVADVVIGGNARLWSAMEEKERLYAKEDDLTDEDGMRLGDLECVVAEEDGYTAEADAATLLIGLGVDEELHDKPMAHLQGGMKVRVLLARALFGNPEALLLDEPTNHLDLDSIRWLEDFLIGYDGALVVISHDRRFLNAVCDHIADIDYQTIISYTGNYDEMVRAKSQVRSRIDRENQAKSKKIAQLQEFISKFGAGTRASQTRSRARQIEKLRPDEIKRSNIARPYIRFTVGEQPSGRDVLAVRDLSHQWEEDPPLFSGLNLDLQRGDKVAILGKNGIGKTSLLRILLDQVKPTSGSVRWGHNTRIGVMAQEHRHEIEAGSTVYQWLFNHRPEVGEQHVRAVLGRMLFSGEDGAKPTGTLSGGECARLIMSKLILMEYNVLILDEPTNHLDLESISALRDAIEAFDGTCLFVTHDRDLAAGAGTRILAFPKPGELLDYNGPLDEYLAWQDKMKKQK